MKQLLILGAMGLLVSCAQTGTQPEPAATEQGVTDAFMSYKHNGVSLEQVGVIEQEQAENDDVYDNGFSESRYFVLHWLSENCVDGYTVFQNCTSGPCQYKFEWVEGVCE